MEKVKKNKYFFILFLFLFLFVMKDLLSLGQYKITISKDGLDFEGLSKAKGEWRNQMSKKKKIIK